MLDPDVAPASWRSSSGERTLLVATRVEDLLLKLAQLVAPRGGSSAVRARPQPAHGHEQGEQEPTAPPALLLTTASSTLGSLSAPSSGGAEITRVPSSELV